MNPLLLGLLDKVIGTVADFIDPTKKAEAQLAVLKLQQDASFKDIDTALAYAKQQTDINLEEAKSEGLLKSGWRPFIGWIGGVGLAYEWIAVPLGTFAYTTITGHALPVQPPVMDPNLMWLIGSMLGLNIGARSMEKLKGAS